MICFWTRPLYSTVVESLIIDPGKIGRDFPDLFPDSFRRTIIHWMSHACREFRYDIPICFSLTRWFNCLSYSLNASFNISESTVLFGKAGRRQYYVSILSRVGHKDILYYQEIQFTYRLLNFCRIRFTHYWISAHNVHGPHLAFGCSVKHLPDL